jgi:hypothetical protein
VLFGSAGWLFADLMLALVVMLFLATVISTPSKPPAKPPVHRPPATRTTTTTPPPTTTRPPGLLPDPIHLDVEVDTNGLMNNDPAAIAAIRQNVIQQLTGPLGGRQVGMVLTFGTAPSSNIQHGIQVANAFDAQVLQALGGQFAGAAYQGFFQGGGDQSKITLQIFVYR